MEHKLFREDYLIDSLVAINELHWVDDDTIPYLVFNKDNEVFEVDDCLFTPIDKISLIDENGEEIMVCDGVVFFGDGTIEFHSFDDLDAYNWCCFTDDSISKVETEIAKIMKEKFA